MPYLNALPLLEGLDEEPGIEIRRAVPSTLSRWLADGEIDAATLPIIDASADPSYRVVPGIAIASRGPVRSVCLFHRPEVSDLRTVALDPASRTSGVLLRLLLELRFGVRPEYLDGSAALDGPEPDGRLLIGDAALFEEPGDRRVLDLGEAWTAWTGRPFVYAAWVLRGEAGALPERLHEARRRGTAAISRLAAEAAGRTGRPPDRIESYLREAMRYDLGEEEVEAVSLYHEYAGKIGALPEGRRVRLLPDG